MVGNWFNVWMVSSFLKEKLNNFQFIGLIKVQKRAAVIGIDYLAALSVIAPCPVFCVAVVPSVPAARYCKRSF